MKVQGGRAPAAAKTMECKVWYPNVEGLMLANIILHLSPDCPELKRQQADAGLGLMVPVKRSRLPLPIRPFAPQGVCADCWDAVGPVGATPPQPDDAIAFLVQAGWVPDSYGTDQWVDPLRGGRWVDLPKALSIQRVRDANGGRSLVIHSDLKRKRHMNHLKRNRRFRR